MIIDGGAAFPTSGYIDVPELGAHTIANPDSPRKSKAVPPSSGMSLRDWFAGQALVGMYASDEPGWECVDDSTAIRAYEIADAMLKAREMT